MSAASKATWNAFFAIKPNLPPTKWPLGRVTECIVGRDAKVRTVRIKTVTSSLLRPIAKIALLPVDLEPETLTL